MGEIPQMDGLDSEESVDPIFKNYKYMDIWILYKAEENEEEEEALTQSR